MLKKVSGIVLRMNSCFTKYCAIRRFTGYLPILKEGLYRIWCGVNRLGDSGVHTLGDTPAFVNPAGRVFFFRGLLLVSYDLQLSHFVS